MPREPKPKATYADVLAAPENMIAEIIDGVLHTQPRPAFPHARAAGKLAATLDGPFDSGESGPGGWVLLFEPEIHLHDEVLVPDFAGWRRERMPEVPSTPACELAPDWLCEVMSPGTAATDRAQKMPIYAREGVAFVWLVDPLLRTLEAYRLEREHWLQIGVWRDDARARIQPFEAIEFDLAVLWSR